MLLHKQFHQNLSIYHQMQFLEPIENCHFQLSLPKSGLLNLSWEKKEKKVRMGLNKKWRINEWKPVASPIEKLFFCFKFSFHSLSKKMITKWENTCKQTQLWEAFLQIQLLLELQRLKLKNSHLPVVHKHYFQKYTNFPLNLLQQNCHPQSRKKQFFFLLKLQVVVILFPGWIFAGMSRPQVARAGLSPNFQNCHWIIHKKRKFTKFEIIELYHEIQRKRKPEEGTIGIQGQRKGHFFCSYDINKKRFSRDNNLHWSCLDFHGPISQLPNIIIPPGPHLTCFRNQHLEIFENIMKKNDEPKLKRTLIIHNNTERVSSRNFYNSDTILKNNFVGRCPLVSCSITFLKLMGIFQCSMRRIKEQTNLVVCNFIKNQKKKGLVQKIQKRRKKWRNLKKKPKFIVPPSPNISFWIKSQRMIKTCGNCQDLWIFSVKVREVQV